MASCSLKGISNFVIPSIHSLSYCNAFIVANRLFAMLSTAFIAHYNAPRFYSSLRKRSSTRFSLVTSAAFLLSCGFFVAVMIIGFFTFGDNCQGFILNNCTTTETHKSSPSAIKSQAFGSLESAEKCIPWYFLQ